ncbi:MAG: hypothetical protein M1817_000284 [Caeruleum heppii]|nr:MAG: hypothetical protein M1817_000284 [Caeruleum heppii]
MSGGYLHSSRNVFGAPLSLFSKSPMTGFKRNGFCEVPPEDRGNHSVAAEVTEEFLDFSASQGNNLRSIGLTGGCKWCLCVERWKEALKARKNDDDPVVPKVFLHATNKEALNGVTMEDLKKFAAEGEAANASTNAVTPGEKPGHAIKEVGSGSPEQTTR